MSQITSYNSKRADQETIEMVKYTKAYFDLTDSLNLSKDQKTKLKAEFATNENKKPALKALIEDYHNALIDAKGLDYLKDLDKQFDLGLNWNSIFSHPDVTFKSKFTSLNNLTHGAEQMSEAVYLLDVNTLDRLKSVKEKLEEEYKNITDSKKSSVPLEPVEVTSQRSSSSEDQKEVLRQSEEKKSVKKSERHPNNKIQQNKVVETVYRKIELTSAEAFKGCIKSVKVRGRMRSFTVPARTKTGDTIRFKVDPYLECIVEVSSVASTPKGNSSGLLKIIGYFALIAVGVWALYNSSLLSWMHSDSSTLPDCTGMNIEDAEFKSILNELDDNQVSYSLDSVESSTADNLGKIVSQSTKDCAYNEIEEQVYFEYAGEADVIGWSMDDAISEYENAGWSTDYYYEDSSSYSADTVTSQTVDLSDRSVTFCISRTPSESNDSTNYSYEASAPDDDFIIPGSDQKYIYESDIENLSEAETQWAINEIYARRGRIFKGNPYTLFWGKCSWYNPIYSADEFKDEWLNEYEWANVKVLSNHRKKVQKNPPKETENTTTSNLNNGVSTYGADAAYHKGIYANYSGDFILPGSDEKYYYKSDIENFSEWETQWAINEIFARHGRDFKGKPYSTYFRKCSWYEPLYSSEEFKKEWFNGYETENIKLLSEHRKSIKKKK